MVRWCSIRHQGTADPHTPTDGRPEEPGGAARGIAVRLHVLLGVGVQGGQRGSIVPFREQCLRIACANFKLQWSEGSKLVVSDTKIVDGLEFWGNEGRRGWAGDD